VSSVVVTQVSKRYGRTIALDAVDLIIPDGSITAVLGPSGCGKTTLLRIIAGFVRTDAGSVAIGDRVVEAADITVRPERRGIGYVPQEGALFPHLSVAANILFGLPRAQRSRARLAELLELAELPAGIADRAPHEISGGQQQRVALARALAPRPSVVLLDEPFSSLDAALRVSAGRTVSRVLRHAKATAVLVTHDQGEALSLADQVAVMRSGRVVQADTPLGIYQRPADTQTASFVGGATVLAATARDGLATCALGPVAISGPDGPVSMVLRPEQVHVVAADAGSVNATVREVSFFGAHAVVVLELIDRTVVTARAPSAAMPAVGDLVGLIVEGRAVTIATGGGR
jgi:iron(III) transport system ATP-binding protein